MEVSQDTSLTNLKKRNFSYIPTRHVVFGDISSVVEHFNNFDKTDLLQSQSILPLKTMLEIILEWSLEHIGLDEFVKAQGEFQNLWGKVSDEDSFYHLRMNYFLDYFLFQRTISTSKDGTSADQDTASEYMSNEIAYLKFLSSPFLKNKIISEPVKMGFHALSTNRNSFFQVLKTSKNRLYLRDLLTLEQHTLFTGDPIGFIGMNKSTILQGFLFLLPTGPELSSGVLIHPRNALGLIKKNIKKAKISSDFTFRDLLMLASKQNLATFRHRGLDIKKIYASNPKFI